jgi:hypothetical protein
MPETYRTYITKSQGWVTERERERGHEKAPKCEQSGPKKKALATPYPFVIPFRPSCACVVVGVACPAPSCTMNPPTAAAVKEDLS